MGPLSQNSNPLPGSSNSSMILKPRPLLDTTYVTRKHRNQVIRVLQAISPQEQDKAAISHYIEFLSIHTAKKAYIRRDVKEKVDSIIEKYWDAIAQKLSSSAPDQNSSGAPGSDFSVGELQPELIAVRLPKEKWQALLKLEKEGLGRSVRSALVAIREAIPNISTKIDVPLEQFLDEVEQAMEESIPHRDTWTAAFNKYNHGCASIQMYPGDFLSTFDAITQKITRQLNKESSVSKKATEAMEIEQWLLRNEPSLDEEED